MSALVYQAINAVAAELASTGIAKTHRNEEGDYNYRSIEDVLGALSPLLAKHRLCVLPRVLSREAVRLTRTSQLTILHIAYDLISALDGSRHTIESVGEAIDEGDKGSAKAMSAAYKAAMLQAFAVPVPQEDSDRSAPRLNGGPATCQAIPEPPEGWESWAKEVTHIVASCETSEAIDRLLTSRRATLIALQKSRSELYAKLGEAIASRLSALQGEAHFHPPDEAKVSAGSRAGITSAPTRAVGSKKVAPGPGKKADQAGMKARAECSEARPASSARKPKNDTREASGAPHQAPQKA